MFDWREALAVIGISILAAIGITLFIYGIIELNTIREN